MPQKVEAQVSGEEKDGVPAGTPAPEGVPAGTPSQPSAIDVEKLTRDYETRLAQAQQDMNKMKGSLQSQAAKQEAAFKAQVEELRQELRDARKSSMTDEQRAQYEESLQAEEFTKLQAQLEEAEVSKRQMAQIFEAWNFFVAQGVPTNKLVTTEGYEALANSGWNFLNAERDALKQEIAALKAKPEPKKDELNPLPTAPAVVTDKGQPGGGTTWAALRKQYGSEENVYRAVEEGKLDPSIIPLE